jgi:adenylosuccinate synthase
MPVSIIIGGQFGSEGKGKVAHCFTQKEDSIKFVVRCGGPNSGHTVIDELGQPRIFQQLPTASIIPGKSLAICAGSYIDLDILFKEIEETELTPERLFIDKDAVIITDQLKTIEQRWSLIKDIGSTGSGTGVAVAARMVREKTLLFAKDVLGLKPYTTDVAKILRTSLDKGERVLIEGTQGFGLSPLHSRFYPYVTSRDTTAAAFLSETGLSPVDVDQIILTIRAFPIRVSGNSGPLPNEIDWGTLSTSIGCDTREYTSVTKQLRRVAEFDTEIVRRAIEINNPTTIVLNHLDYISKEVSSDKIQRFVTDVEKGIGRKVDYLGFNRSSIKHIGN